MDTHGNPKGEAAAARDEDTSVATLLHACIRAGTPRRASELYETFTASGYKPSTSGPHAGITYTLTVGTAACFVGRSSGKKFREKGISLSKDNEVSTTHAKIELQRDEVVLVDVGSTNGTTLDGESIEEAKPYPLKAGSNVIFGGSAFTVHSIDALN